MPKKYRDVRRALRRSGWTLTRSTGSHEIWTSPDGDRTVTVAGGGKPNREVPTGTLATIRRETGIKDLR